MTTFSDTGPAARLRLDRGDFGASRLGIDRSLIAPGVVPSYGQGGAARLEQYAGMIDSFIGLGGALAQGVAQRRADEAQQDAIRREMQAAEADLQVQHADAIVKQQRGLGERDARLQLPLIQEEIAADKLAVPDGTDTAAFTRQLLAERFDGIDPEYQDAAVALIENDVAKAFTDRRSALQTVATKDSLALMGQNLIGKTPEYGIKTLEQARRFPGAANLTDAQIREQVILPAVQAFANGGRPEEVRKWSGLLGDYTKFQELETKAEKVKADVEAQEKSRAVAYLSALTEATKNPNSGQTYAGLSEAIENLRPQLGDSLTNEKLAEVENIKVKAGEQRIASAQQQGAARLFALAEIGGLTREELQNTHLKRTLLPASDPNYLSLEQYRSVDARINEKKKTDEVRSEILGVLSGQPGIVSQERHGKAIGDMLREGGAITDSRVTDPSAVVSVAQQARLVPKEVAGAIESSLASDNMADVTNAINTIGGLAAGGFATAVTDQVDPRMAPIVEVVRAAQLNGTLSTDTGKAKVAARIQLIKQNMAEGKGPTKEQLNEVARGLGASGKYGQFIADSIADDVAAVRDQFPQAVDTVPFAPDFLDPDPAIDAYDPGIARRMEAWYTTQYQKLAPTLGEKEAAEGARAYAREQLTRSVDFIRWGNQVRPVLIDTGTNRLPEAMRWTPVAETEAKDALKAAGANPDDVRTIAPLIDSGRQGWVFLDYDGLPMLDPQTQRVMLYTPSTASQRAAIEAQKVRDARAAQFTVTGGHFPIANSFNAFSGF